MKRTFTVRSREVLERKEREWRATLGGATINRAVTVSTGPGWVRVETETGDVLLFAIDGEVCASCAAIGQDPPMPVQRHIAGRPYCFVHGMDVYCD